MNSGVAFDGGVAMVMVKMDKKVVKKTVVVNGKTVIQIQKLFKKILKKGKDMFWLKEKLS